MIEYNLLTSEDEWESEGMIRSVCTYAWGL